MKNFTIDLTNVLNLQNFSGVIPLFPLATVVFFPNTLLPLHVFEPRYRQMIKDIIDGERIIGMVLLKPGWEKSYEGNPEIYSVVGMGRIVNSEPLDDGRFNIVLYGLKRVKIIDIVKDIPYRLARVEILEDVHGTNENIYRERILELILKWNGIIGKEHESHLINIDTRLPLENLIDAIASTSVSNVVEKQELLEEINVQKRAENILTHLETKVEVISIVAKRRNQIVEKRNLN
ncbi:MAG TPA: LON peptidase substrate-binding domain-containing protein [Thermodesulfobacteriota bacterium]|nr:LON peptidase substrate-binding domain-containing protein [Thermodesulfobacteriota bacterium]